MLKEFPQLEFPDEPGRVEPLRASEVSESTKAKCRLPKGPILRCQLSYQIHCSKEQVYEYYSGRLTAHEWTLANPPPATATDEPVPILAHRSSFSCEVAASRSTPDEFGTHVRASVWEASEETP